MPIHFWWYFRGAFLFSALRATKLQKNCDTKCHYLHFKFTWALHCTLRSLGVILHVKNNNNNNIFHCIFINYRLCMKYVWKKTKVVHATSKMVGEVISSPLASKTGGEGDTPCPVVLDTNGEGFCPPVLCRKW